MNTHKFAALTFRPSSTFFFSSTSTRKNLKKEILFVQICCRLHCSSFFFFFFWLHLTPIPVMFSSFSIQIVAVISVAPYFHLLLFIVFHSTYFSYVHLYHSPIRSSSCHRYPIPLLSSYSSGQLFLFLLLPSIFSYSEGHPSVMLLLLSLKSPYFASFGLFYPLYKYHLVSPRKISI